jgi:hypothetical protein
MKKLQYLMVIGLIGILLSVSSIAYGGILEEPTLPDGVEIIESDGVDNAVNNDNVAPSVEDLFNYGNDEDNWVAIFKEFTSLDPIDIVLPVSASGGTTEYLFIEAIANFTDYTWTDFHVELGVDVQGRFQRLSEVDSEDLGLDLDWDDEDPEPMSFYITAFDPVELSPLFERYEFMKDAIYWYDGELDPTVADPDMDDLAWFAYSIDIPDIGDLEEYQFTLRQYPTICDPTIPEPSSMLLVGFGLFGAGLLRKRRS